MASELISRECIRQKALVGGPITLHCHEADVWFNKAAVSRFYWSGIILWKHFVGHL